MRDRVRAAIASLPPRERKVIGLYYYAEATMKQIGAEIGVNESRVSQLHARAIQRLRKALGADSLDRRGGAGTAARHPVLRADDEAAEDGEVDAAGGSRARTETPAVVLPYKAPRDAAPSRSRRVDRGRAWRADRRTRALR